MLILPWLWAVFTLIAAAAQTVRNATQRELTGSSVRSARPMCASCSGCRSRCIFLVGVMLALGRGLPQPDPMYLGLGR